MQRGDPAFSFDRFGADPPRHPVIISVPHAGRVYPRELIDNLRVPVAHLRPLEDRWIDAVATTARHDATTFIARMPRAWIDLNRAESERDPLVEHGLPRHGIGAASAKVRAGLGLVPRRAGRSGDLWATRLAAGAIDVRIRDDHRPYHAALAQALDAARARFGVAVLLDLHSMPSLVGDDAARVVIGDRYGKTAHRRFVACVEGTIRAAGLRVALNSPYAGGHILDRHGAPRDGIHAIQLELDRSLYLDAALDRPGPGLDRMAALLRLLVAALADEASPHAAAAE